MKVDLQGKSGRIVKSSSAFRKSLETRDRYETDVKSDLVEPESVVLRDSQNNTLIDYGREKRPLDLLYVPAELQSNGGKLRIAWKTEGSRATSFACIWIPKIDSEAKLRVVQGSKGEVVNEFSGGEFMLPKALRWSGLKSNYHYWAEFLFPEITADCGPQTLAIHIVTSFEHGRRGS